VDAFSVESAGHFRIWDLAPDGRTVRAGIVLEDGTVALVLNPSELMEGPSPSGLPSVSKDLRTGAGTSTALIPV